ncbi:hypothetical protein ACP275_13G112400 [Erythranthe tilingii]
MGIIQSIIRFLCCKTQTEDEESGRIPFLVDHQPNQDYVHKLPYKPIRNKDPILPIKNNSVLPAVTFPNSAATSQIRPPAAHFVNIGTKLDDRTQLRYYDATSRQWRLPKSTSKDTTQKALPFAEDESKKKIVVEKPKEKKEATINNNIVKSSSTSSTRVVVAAAVDDVRWIKHYSSRHRVLVVGDGDFSFSASLAVAFGCASNMTATSLDSLDFLKKNYWNAKLNIEELRSRGCMVIHGVDVTKMAKHRSLGHLNFDRIVYNFPYAGLFKHLSRESQLQRHRTLASLFLKNAKEMINEDGEIHISHKTNGFHGDWKLVSIASSHELRLIESVDFDLGDYPGYNTKYGFGGDGNFNCYPSNTYKFGLKYY